MNFSKFIVMTLIFEASLNKYSEQLKKYDIFRNGAGLLPDEHRDKGYKMIKENYDRTFQMYRKFNKENKNNIKKFHRTKDKLKKDGMRVSNYNDWYEIILEMQIQST